MGTALQPQPPIAAENPPEQDHGAIQRLYAVIQRSAVPLAAFISLVSFLRYTAYSSRRLWFDEVYTATVALQPRWIDVWNAFRAAVDFQPPLFSFVTRISWMLFGRNEVALRMPEILGVILFSWCIFFFVGKRLGFVFGLSAMILSLVNDLEFYSAQARPYGMLLAACGLAMLAWRNAVENPRRRVSLPLFAASLALIVSTHAYAITAVAMFAIAELARYLRTRRADWSLWICFLPTLLPLSLFWFPFHAMKAAKGGVLGPQKWVHWSSVPGFYTFFFRDRFLLCFLVGALLVGLAFLRKGTRERASGMPAHEIALAAALAASPLFCVTMAMLVTRFYLPHYSIYAIAGIVILVIVLIDAVGPNRRMASLLLLALSLLLFGLDQFYVKFNRDAMRKRDIGLEVPFASVPPRAPVVIASGLALLPTDMYASDADLARTYYLTGHEECVKYTGSTFFEFGPPFTDYYHFRTRLEPYRDFIKSHKKFYVYGPYFYQDDWQIRKLLDDGARVVEKGKFSGEATGNYLLEVEMP